MSDFNAAIQVVLGHEGGFVDNPADRGGPTHFGITQASATAYLGGEPASVDYIRNLTPAIAAAIYRKNYWTPLHLDSIPDEKLATVCFDLAVLRGIPSLVRGIQSVCGLGKIDGILGPDTLMKFQQEAALRPRKLGLNLILHFQVLFSDFVSKNPDQLQFLNGWMNRLKSLTERVVS